VRGCAPARVHAAVVNRGGAGLRGDGGKTRAVIVSVTVPAGSPVIEIVIGSEIVRIAVGTDAATCRRCCAPGAVAN
jgi:hypothetical protein